MAEFDLIVQIQSYFPHSRDDTHLGIGDDGAVIQSAGALTVVTDTLVEGVHFFPTVAAADLGWKSLAVNLSDLAAMGAQPAWALLNLTLPRDDVEFVAEFSRGFAELAQQFAVELVGGDTTQGPLSVTVTAMGHQPSHPLCRSGARPGDHLFVSGELGAAAWACQTLYREQTPDHKALVCLLKPQPRVELGLRLVALATAAMDLSDGLGADIKHMLKASSRGSRQTLGADIQLQQLPTAAAMTNLSDEQRWSLQLHGGDDYELLFTLPEEALQQLPLIQQETGLTLSCIGRVSDQAGVRYWRPDGHLWTTPKTGYEHFKENAS